MVATVLVFSDCLLLAIHYYMDCAVCTHVHCPELADNRWQSVSALSLGTRQVVLL